MVYKRDFLKNVYNLLRKMLNYIDKENLKHIFSCLEFNQ